MTIACATGDGLGYSTCRYGQSKLVFRGSGTAPEQDYIAFLGSTETFGKSVSTPYPDLVSAAIGQPTLNLGCVNAGIDTFSSDATVRNMCQNARATVVQIVGADKLSNPFYTVHGRRNDRFIAAHQPLRALFPDVDFTGINFARHLIETLAADAPERLLEVREVLRIIWISKMRALVDGIDGPVVFLWISRRPLDMRGNDPTAEDPLFVTREMIAELRRPGVSVVEVVVGAEDHAPPLNTHLGEHAHSKAAAALSEILIQIK